MSFDLTFFRPGSGGKPRDEYSRLVEIDIFDRPPLSAAESARLRNLLVAVHPGFGTSELPVRENNSFQVFDESLALSMDVDSILIELNLAYLRDKSTEAFAMIAKIGRALASEGFLCFNLQTGELVDWDKDLEAMRHGYDILPSQLEKAIPLRFDGVSVSKPWWKFW